MAVTMEAHALALFASDLTEKFGVPQVLDVEQSIRAHKPTLSGARSPSSYYIRPPETLSAYELIQLFEAVPGFQNMRLTLTPILGIDTYHQPLISVDDFAKKYFSDNHLRIVRVVGGSNRAIEAMAAFVDGLKRPFSAQDFPHHAEFLVSGYRTSAPGLPGHLKLLFKPADPIQLMRVERMVNLHLAENNMVRDIGVSRHVTREQPPELILSALSEEPKGRAYLEALAASLPRATTEAVAEAVLASERTSTRQSEAAPKARPHFGMSQGADKTLPQDELLRRVTGRLAGILKEIGIGAGLKVVLGGTGIDVEFPRAARALWLASSFDERKDMKAVKSACVAVRSDPEMREGWDLHYRFDSKEGKLQLRTVDRGATPSNGAMAIPLMD